MTGQGATVNVDVHDALPDVIARLRQTEGSGPVRFSIPAGSSLFLTATEFCVLKDALQGRSVVVITDDPLRRQLAGMFGLAGPTGALPATPIGEGTRAAVINPGQPQPPPHSGGSRAAVPGALSTTDGGRNNQDVEMSGDQTPRRLISPFAIIRSRFQRGPAHQAAPPAPGSEEETAEGRGFPAAEAAPPAASGWSVAGISPRLLLDRLPASLRWHPPARRGTRPSARMVASVLGAILIAATLAVAAAILLLPRATVAVTLKQQPVRGELVYAILPEGAEPGQGVDLTINGQPVEQEISYEATIQTTGTRSEPDAAASGTVRLSNPNTEEITIEAGSTVTSDEGIAYAFIEEVVVPPAVPDQDRFGAAAATVEAAEGGTVTNLDTGELSGQLESGVYYSNRDGPISGGTDKTVPIVAAEDLATLREQAEAELPAVAEGELAASLSQGTELVPGSLKPGELETSFDRGEGEDARTVTIRATAPVTALTYQPAGAVKEATARLRDELASQAPSGYALDPASLLVSEPTPVTEADELRFRITAEGRTLAAFPDTERTRLARALAGKAPADAEKILRDQPGIDRFRITYAPDWLPDRMPSSAGRIDLNFTG